MMRDDSKAILDEILGKWHAWAKSEQLTPTTSVCAMFNGMRSPRAWDTMDEVLDGEINHKTMKTVEFEASELKEPHKTAIYINARNCYTGRNIWFSPRLTTDPKKLAEIVSNARAIMTRRLMAAGVI